MTVGNVSEISSEKHASVEPGGTFDKLDTRILQPDRRTVFNAELDPYKLDVHAT